MTISGGLYRRASVWVVGVSLLGLFGLCAGLLFGLPAIGRASASDTRVSLDVEGVLSLTTTPVGTLAIPVSPSADGSITTRTLAVDVGTNNPGGFTLTMNADSAEVNLVHAVDSSSTITPPTSASLASPQALTANSWGFAAPKTQTNATGLLPNDTNNFDNTYSVVTDASAASYTNVFAPIPVLASPLILKQTEANAVSDSTSLVFGANVNQMKRSGSYQNTIVFSAVGNYVGPSAPTTMQEMTASYCANDMSEGDTIELRDERDDNEYTVAKIGDKCWMADNLALGDESGAMTLTPEDSDVSANWTLPAPITSSTSPDAASSQWIPANFSGDSYCAPTGAIDCGNVYNFKAATAGTDPSSGEASSSVCPVNWRLPTGGDSGEYMQLVTDLDWPGVSGDTVYFSDPPFSGVLSGYYYSGHSDQQGYIGFYWAATVTSPTSAYSLFFTGASMTPGTNENPKAVLSAVRCVLR